MIRKITVTLLLGVSLFGFGGPPTQTDDPNTPGAGNWDINVLVAGIKSQHEHVTEAPIFDINYGPTDTTEVKLEVLNATKKELEDSEELTDIDEIFVETGIKWRFYKDEALSLSVFPQYAHIDINEEVETIITLPIQMLYRFSPQWGFTMEASYQIVDNKDAIETPSNRIELGGVLTYITKDGTDLMFEIRDVSEPHFKDHYSAYLFAYKQRIALNIRGLFSIGKVFRHDHHETGLIYFAGLNFQF
jgi:hypothetical protein